MNNQFLTIALDAAKAAQEVILHYSSSDIRATLKEDQTSVTVADQEAEEIIKKVISKAFPDHGFLGEETGKSNKSEYVWIIDPIDGTKNYLRQIPLFATQIALSWNGQFIVGVSNAPKINQLMYASLGNGAFLNEQKVAVSKIDQLKDAYVSSGTLKSYKETENIESKFDKLIDQTNWYRKLGDFWQYHLVAQGKIDISLEAAIKIWDIAAITVIIREAGGEVTDIKGEPINMDSTSILATNKILHQQILDLLK